LSIRETDDGLILVHCFGGCETEAIVKAMGLTMRDLFPKLDRLIARTGKADRGNREPQKKPAPKGKVYGTFKEAVAVLDGITSKQQGQRAGHWVYSDACRRRMAMIFRRNSGAARSVNL
jgi:hypothetical protein